MRKTIAVALVVMGLGSFIETVSAKPVVLERYVSTKTAVSRNCMIDGGKMTTESTGKYSCLNDTTGIAHNCSSFGACETVCVGKACGASVKKNKKPAGSGKAGTGKADTPSSKPAAGAKTVVRDHRKPDGVKPTGKLPPAAAPGTVSTRDHRSNRDETAATSGGTKTVVRDHRKR